MPDYTKLPLAVTSFREIVDNKLLYVDKTDFIAHIACNRSPVFLSRPRRFGKSTLVETMHELFAHGLKRFAGLKISRQHLWQEKKQDPGYSKAQVVQELAANYNGYCFDEEDRWHVYNPWTILNFLRFPGRGFRPYWLETGGVQPALLIKYLHRRQFFSATGYESLLNLDNLARSNCYQLSPAIKSLQDKDFPFFAILYQAG